MCERTSTRHSCSVSLSHRVVDLRTGVARVKPRVKPSQNEALLFSDVEYSYERDGVEQKGGAGGGPGDAPPEAVLPAHGVVRAHPARRTRTAHQDPGVLLRQHELPQGLPEDRRPLLQK